MVDLMCEQVLIFFQNVAAKISFVSLNANESIIIDNQSWILVHVYVMQAWTRVLILFTLLGVEMQKSRPCDY
jgi:hypothetical protein